MTLRPSFLPLQPEFDQFLFATVGDETDGMPLSVVSAFARLGLDPWQEAGRLSSLGRREAVEQLARLIGEFAPAGSRQRDETQKIAGGLIGLLPTRDAKRSVPQIQSRTRFRMPRMPGSAQLWVVCLVLAAAVLISAVLHGGLPFGIGSP